MSFLQLSQRGKAIDKTKFLGRYSITQDFMGDKNIQFIYWNDSLK